MRGEKRGRVVAVGVRERKGWRDIVVGCVFGAVATAVAESGGSPRLGSCGGGWAVDRKVRNSGNGSLWYVVNRSERGSRALGIDRKSRLYCGML